MNWAIFIIAMALLISYAVGLKLWINFMFRRGKEIIAAGGESWRFWFDRFMADYKFSLSHLWPGHWYHTWIRWRS